VTVIEPTWSYTFAAAAEVARVELACAVCRYGVVVGTPPTRCPMCGGTTWVAGLRLPAVEALSERVRELH
jgi:hypothetical protein